MSGRKTPGFLLRLLGVGWLWLALPAGLAQAPDRPREVAPKNLPRLIDIHAIRELPLEALQRGYPVSLEGRVVQAVRSRNLITLQVGETGIVVYVTDRRGTTTIGQKVRVEGFTVAQREVEVLANKLTVIDPTVVLPPPKRVSVEQMNIEQPMYCLVELTGVVAAVEQRPLRYELKLRDREHTFPVHVPRNARVEPPANLIDSKMSFVGVASELSSDQVRLLVRGWQDTTVLKPAPQQPFQRTRKQIAAIRKTKQLPEYRVRVRGEVLTNSAAGVMRLRDESGVLDVRLAGHSACSPGEFVDVMGFVTRDDAGIFLDHAAVRRLGLPRTRLAVDHRALPGTKLDDYVRIYQQVSGVRRLSKKQLEERPPVLLNGKLVHRDPHTGMLYLQDGSGGIGVIAADTNVPPIGAHVEVRGFAISSPTSPIVKWARWKKRNEPINIHPLRGSTAALSLGRLDSQWISLDGVGRWIEIVGDETHLMLARTGGKILVRIAGGEQEELSRFEDARLMVRCVARTLLDSDGQNVGSELLVGDLNDIEITEPAPTNAFAIPFLSIDHLKRFRAEGSYTRRNRTGGIVTLAWPNLVQLDDGTNVLRVRVNEATGLLVGHRAEVVGFPHLGRFGLEFEDAKVKDLGPATAIAPRVLAAREIMREGRDGHLVEVEGTVIKQVAAANEHLLILQSQTETFPVVLPGMYVTPGMREIEEGSRLRVRGVLRLEAESQKPPHSFRILLPDADAFTVLEQAPWWTAARLTAALGALGVFLALILFWADGLRRRSLRSETRFARAVNSSPVAVAILKADGSVLEINDRFAQLTGLAREKALGQTLAGLRVWPEMPTVAELLAGTRTGGIDRETAWRKADGEFARVLISGEAIEMDGHDALLLSAVDVSERVRLLERLRDSQKMEAVGQLAAGVAHDFNNLLTVIRGNTEMLKEDLGPNSEMAELNEEVEAAAERASELTRKLLAFSRKQVLHIRSLAVNELVTGSLRMLRRLLEENIEIEAVLPDASPLVNADAAMLEQVLVNLAVNARDAMPGGGRLTLQVDTVNYDITEPGLPPDVGAGPFVRISVSDTGIGMNRATRERIFEPFFTTKKIGQGTGLGLATVYGIVSQHRGWVSVESAPGAGSKFIIHLPEYLADDQAAPPDDAGRYPGGTESILLVEDETQVRRTAKSILTRAGYRVTEAGDAADARRQWNESRDDFDLLLTDILMPGGETGVDLARHFREQRPELKIITITGYSGDSASRADIDALGATFVYKPFTRASLTRLVRAVLDGEATPTQH